MKTFIGTGVGQPEAAVHQAVQGLTSPSAILFMASYEHFKETASRLKELFPDTPCIGTIGTRLVNGQVNDSGLAVLGFFSDVKIRCGIITEASRCPAGHNAASEADCRDFSRHRRYGMRGILYRLRRKAGNHVYILSGNKGHPSGRRHRFRCPRRQTSGRCI